MGKANGYCWLIAWIFLPAFWFQINQLRKLKATHWTKPRFGVMLRFCMTTSSLSEKRL